MTLSQELTKPLKSEGGHQQNWQSKGSLKMPFSIKQKLSKSSFSEFWKWTPKAYNNLRAFIQAKRLNNSKNIELVSTLTCPTPISCSEKSKACNHSEKAAAWQSLEGAEQGWGYRWSFIPREWSLFDLSGGTLEGPTCKVIYIWPASELTQHKKPFPWEVGVFVKNIGNCLILWLPDQKT